MKANSSFKRKEMKFILSPGQYKALKESIGEDLIPDDYPRYSICNLYMDTPDFRLIRRSMEKPVYKEKMRLRSYGPSSGRDRIFMELKKKYKGIVYKRRTCLPLDDAISCIGGKSQPGGQIEREIEYFIDFYKDLEPRMYISYDREAYRGKDDSDFRLTFDRNILWRDEDLSLSSINHGNQLLNKDEVLMEIKCTGSMPLWLARILGTNRIYQSSFSKYGRAYSQKIWKDSRAVSGL